MNIVVYREDYTEISFFFFTFALYSNSSPTECSFFFVGSVGRLKYQQLKIIIYT